MRRQLLGGFTLLEVMVAVAILSIAIIGILSSQGGAIRTGTLARQTSIGTFLARCKMAELEEKLLREGFSVTGESGEDECCEDGEQEGFVCSWSVDPVVLPDAIDMGDDADPLAAPGGVGATPEAGQLGSLNQDDLTSALAGGGTGGFGSFALQYTYPFLRPMIEQQVRRATVTVRWRNGLREPTETGPCEPGELDCLSVVQYIVAEPGAGAMTSEEALTGGSQP